LPISPPASATHPNPEADVVQHRPDTAWWLSGSELCRHCCQPYVLEAECRCTDCDGGLCMHCAVLEESLGRHLCPSCRDTLGSDGDEQDD
jgi:hypothetical protein